MPFSRLVVDANILVSALLKNASTRQLLLLKPGLELHSPEYLEEELFAHLKLFAEKLGTEESRVQTALRGLLKEAKIHIAPVAQYSSCLTEAIEFSPDPKDAPYLALALTLDCPLWSQDKALKKQDRVRILTTSEILQVQK